MAQSNISGPFNITNGLIVGGTAHITGALTLDAGQSASGNLTAGTSVIWASGTAGQWTGVTTSGNVTAGTSLIWPNGTADTSGITIRGAGTASGNLSMGGTVLTFGTQRLLWGTFPATGVVGVSNAGDFLFNSRPASGSATHWVCTAPGTPGTWLANGSAS